ncbi:MAG TPA: hypothetical protein VGV67_14140 [Solirubrobacteraceae bacterium]|nr:hypothetical protein [Solirubrobacteraceae bacterium]
MALELDSRTIHDTDPACATDRGLAGGSNRVYDLDLRPAELAADVHALLRAAKVA